MVTSITSPLVWWRQTGCCWLWLTAGSGSNSPCLFIWSARQLCLGISPSPSLAPIFSFRSPSTSLLLSDLLFSFLSFCHFLAFSTHSSSLNARSRLLLCSSFPLFILSPLVSSSLISSHRTTLRDTFSRCFFMTLQRTPVPFGMFSNSNARPPEGLCAGHALFKLDTCTGNHRVFPNRRVTDHHQLRLRARVGVNLFLVSSPLGTAAQDAVWVLSVFAVTVCDVLWIRGSWLPSRLPL